MRANIKFGGYTITWFPMEQQYMVFNKNHMSVSNFMNTIKECEIFITNLGVK